MASKSEEVRQECLSSCRSSGRVLVVHPMLPWLVPVATTG